MHEASVQRIKTARTTEILRKADTLRARREQALLFFGFLPTVLTTS